MSDNKIYFQTTYESNTIKRTNYYLEKKYVDMIMKLPSKKLKKINRWIEKYGANKNTTS